MCEPHEAGGIDDEARLFHRLTRRGVTSRFEHRIGVVREPASRIVLGVDPSPGEHPRPTGKRELRVSPEHEGLDAVGSVTKEHHGGRGHRHVGRGVVTQFSTPISVDSTGAFLPAAVPGVRDFLASR